MKMCYFDRSGQSNLQETLIHIGVLYITHSKAHLKVFFFL